MLEKNNLFLPGNNSYIINRNMHQDLKQSLMHIQVQMQKYNFDNYHVIGHSIKALEQEKFFPPEFFGWYYQSAFNFLSNSDIKAVKCLNNLAEIQPISDDKEIIIQNFNNDYIKANSNMYLSCMGELYNEYDEFHMPKKKQVTEFEIIFNKALSLIKETIPHFFNEVCILMKRVVLLSLVNKQSKKKFNGGAAYQLWRMVFFNLSDDIKKKSVIDMIDFIIHEVSHLYLFGCTTKEPLTFNKVTDKYPSLIRNENRPIDGIYHAMFVTARVYFAMQQILKKLRNKTIYHDDIQNNAKRNFIYYKYSKEAIKKYAILSKTGQKIFEDTTKCIELVA